ncbi:helix-turn-helix transcriptional regulator [Clostridium tagluense]|uniref:Transcriptional regulator n=1 Tax=Clostridium tagluense TaxID=360422 RepID=A0A401UKV2_9CLOT|nr:MULTISPECIES: helix-turn-helix transcriptional regulator [Clostridium]MBU3127508.1 helix-turn-helix transcriptional regulator [Clostridium tagluense]MBW9156794.1 helix-turn-helix transcriptional regulator [Clostridium tagluense]MBZ9621964.1 helix-turn-helix transcriptional regulator [Clostridium sp. FP2]MBZ9633506.1 helix-turn-helix transcriptional regulator [Clostridium sp. FP1]MCB2297482.1 helix-turn-helix transcriptional regulator [Clostridium tagluense]
MDNDCNLDFLKRLAKGISSEFGRNCEVVIHDLSSDHLDYPIIFIENGHVTHRDTSTSTSRVVLNALKHDVNSLEDKLNYITKTHDGKTLKSSTIYIRDSQNKPTGIFSINYDITELTIAKNCLDSMLSHKEDTEDVSNIPQNVNQLLDDLLDESVKKVGKPVALMSKDEKIQAIQFLNDAGAFLITKAGDKTANFFGISKYSIYNYIDIKNKL